MLQCYNMRPILEATHELSNRSPHLQGRPKLNEMNREQNKNAKYYVIWIISNRYYKINEGIVITKKDCFV